MLCLQETYINNSDKYLKQVLYGNIYHAVFSSRARRVLLGFSKRIVNDMDQYVLDPSGRYVVWRGMFFQLSVTFIGL